MARIRWPWRRRSSVPPPPSVESRDAESRQAIRDAVTSLYESKGYRKRARRLSNELAIIRAENNYEAAIRRALEGRG